MREKDRDRAGDAGDATAEAAGRISREEQGGDPRSFIARAGRLLASSLDYETTLRTVAGLALPYLGGWSTVDVVEGEGGGAPWVRHLAIVHPEPGKQEIARRLEKSWPPDREAPIGVPVALRTRESEVVSRVTDEMLRKAARSEENLRDLRALGIGSAVVVPLIVRDRVLGAITFISPEEGEVYTEEHLALAEDLAPLCALAIDNARHYRNAERARHAAEARARAEADARSYADAVVDTVREPLVVLDGDLRVRAANRAFYRLFRTTPAETGGRFVYDVGDGWWGSPRLRQLLEEILRADTAFEDFEVEQDFGALGRRKMLLNARRIHRGEEGMQRILLAMEDVTDRERAAQERERLLERERQARKQAERAMHARKQMLGIVSHDLRSPLNVISGSAQLLQSLPPEAVCEKGEERLRAIVQAADRMNRLIGDLLDVSRLEAGRFPIECEPVDVPALVREAADALRPRAEEASLEFVCAAEEGLGSVSADRDRILQVIENLVGNAIRFTPAGGRIELRVARTEGGVLFSVSDTGSGIPAADLEHLFEPFWQGTGAAEGGAGLGLFIARGIVEAHGGRIWAESRVGEGSTFRFTIPAAGTGQRGRGDVHGEAP